MRKSTTPEQDAEIDRRIAAGERIKDIAGDIGCTPMSIYRRRTKERDPEKLKRQQRAHYERQDKVALNERTKANRLRRIEAHRRDAREWVRQRRANDPEMGKRIYWADKEREDARLRQWRADNPDKRKDNWARRRARKREALVEDVRRGVVWERDGGICGICGKPADKTSWHLDHVVPLARGGLHTYENVQVAHPRCNIAKGARPLPPTAASVQHAFVFDSDIEGTRRSSSRRKRQAA